jgi:di/tricarboxylate transporter
MNLTAWWTLAVVTLMLGALVRSRIAPATAVMGAMVTLLVTGVIEPGQAFAGFANPAPMTVAALFVLARAVEKTGGLQPVLAALLGNGPGHRTSMIRLLAPTAAASAFLNNTPIVAMLAPQVAEWTRRRGVSPSRFLMPLSFAAILGGTITAIGTSTNLVISGLLEQYGHAPLGMFEITKLGIPVTIAGIGLIILLAPILLPDRRGPRTHLEEGTREFVVTMQVEPNGALDHRAVEEGGLRHLMGVFLVDIERGTERLAPVTPSTVLHGGDYLTFVGRADLIVDLQNIRGLSSTEEKHLAGLDGPQHTFYEVVIGAESPLVGHTLKQGRFRSRYQGAVVAIHRAGERVRAKLGDVKLRHGDTLLLLTDPDFRDRWRDRNDFLLISRSGGNAPAMTRKAGVVGVITIAIVVLAGTGLMPILHASLIGAVSLVVLGVLTAGEARNAVDLDVILVIAAAFGIGAAIESSGLAVTSANLLTEAFGTLGARGVLLGIVVSTMVLTELITNNAAAILAFPIGMTAGTAAGFEPRTIALAIAVAASASFLTPIGYQTNTMVFGPGGYRLADYLRLGAPLTLLVLTLLVVLAGVGY